MAIGKHATRLSSDLMLYARCCCSQQSPALSRHWRWTVIGGRPSRQHFVCGRWDMRCTDLSYTIITRMDRVLKRRLLLGNHRVRCVAFFCVLHLVLCFALLISNVGLCPSYVCALVELPGGTVPSWCIAVLQFETEFGHRYHLATVSRSPCNYSHYLFELRAKANNKRRHKPTI